MGVSDKPYKIKIRKDVLKSYITPENFINSLMQYLYNKNITNVHFSPQTKINLKRWYNVSTLNDYKRDLTQFMYTYNKRYNKFFIDKLKRRLETTGELPTDDEFDILYNMKYK